jgi:hypothetical protein
MTLTLEIAPEVEAALKIEAARHGQSVTAYAAARLSEIARPNKPRRHASGFGKFAGRGPTVEEFHAAKQEEIEIEARRG